MSWASGVEPHLSHCEMVVHRRFRERAWWSIRRVSAARRRPQAIVRPCVDRLHSVEKMSRDMFAVHTWRVAYLPIAHRAVMVLVEADLP